MDKIICQAATAISEAADNGCGMKDRRQLCNIVVGYNVFRDNECQIGSRDTAVVYDDYRLPNVKAGIRAI